MNKIVKFSETKEAISYYNSFIFWFITLIFGSSFSLFKNINIPIIHNIILPSILISSGLCILFLIIYNRLYISRNFRFNTFYNFLESQINNINDEDYILLLNDCKIAYIEKNNVITSKPSKLEIICNILYNILFFMSIILFIGLFIFSYIYNLI